MTSSTTSVEHSPRRRPSLDTVSNVERAVAAGLVAILALTAAFLFYAGRTSDDASEGLDPASAPVLETSAADGAAAIEAFILERGAVDGLYVTLGDEPVELRSEPGETAGVVGQIEPGDAAMAFSAGRLEAVGTEVWMEVEYLGATGWVPAELLHPTDAN